MLFDNYVFDSIIKNDSIEISIEIKSHYKVVDF